MQNNTSLTSYSVQPTLISATIGALYISAAAAAIGLVFLVIFFSGVPIFGPMNDVAVIIHYILLYPILFTMWRMLRPYGQRLNNLAFVIGLVGVTSVIVLQTLLVVGVMPFQKQIVLVIPAFLVAMLWFVLTGYLGRSDEHIPNGVGLHVLAGLVFAYPVWAFKLAKNLQIYYRGGM